MAWSKMVSTEMDDDQKFDMMIPSFPGRDTPDYPYGVKLQFDEWLLDRLGLSQDVDVGDVLDMRAFAVVTSVRKEQTDGKSTCCVCLTLEKIAVEDEADESTEPGEDDD